VPELQSPDPGRKLQERYGLIGSTPAPFLSPELVPVVIIDNLADIIPGEAWAISSINVSNVALETSISALTNPLGSGVIFTKIRLSIANPEGTTVFRVSQGAAAVTPTNSQWTDRRRAGAPVAAVTSGTALVPALSNVVITGDLRTQEFLTINLENHVLSPGTALHVSLTTISRTLNGFWEWAEVLS